MTTALTMIGLATPQAHRAWSCRQACPGPAARRAVVAAVCLGHLVAALGLLRAIPAPLPQPPSRSLQVSWIEAPPAPTVASPRSTAPLPTPRRPPTSRPLPPRWPGPTSPLRTAAATIPASVGEPVLPGPPAAALAAALAAAPAPPAPLPLPAPRLDAQYLTNPAPDYPRLSRELGEQGLVVLRVRVSSQGQPLDLQIHSSSRFPRLDQAAVTAVTHWRFVPARRDGESVEATVLVPISFTLHR